LCDCELPCCRPQCGCGVDSFAKRDANRGGEATRHVRPRERPGRRLGVAGDLFVHSLAHLFVRSFIDSFVCSCGPENDRSYDFEFQRSSVRLGRPHTAIHHIWGEWDGKSYEENLKLQSQQKHRIRYNQAEAHGVGCPKG
jgi:hypothetical protein